MEDTDVIVPDLTSSFDVEAVKTIEVQEIEGEQKAIEKRVKAEVDNPKFPLIRQHFEMLVEKYNDIRTLSETNRTGNKFEVMVRTKAAIVAELTDFLSFIDQISESTDQVDGGDASK